MCIIAIKTPNKKFMSKSVLQECFRNNPDGAGFMFPADGMVHIRKGYMDFTSFWRALKEVREQYGDDIPYVMHFRISTQAGVQPACTHPFPLSRKMDDLKMLSCKTKIGIAHNGIIQLTTDHSQKEYSDTMKFITDYVPFFIKNFDWWKSQPAKSALKELCGSKLAILGGDGHVERIGDFVEDGGNFYSNTTYKVPKTKSTNWWNSANYVSHSLYDDDYGYNYGYGYGGSFAESDDWESYYDESVQMYEFTEEYCPMSMDDEDMYCPYCKNCNNCQTFKNLTMDTGYNLLSAENLKVSETPKVEEPKKKSKKTKKSEKKGKK